MVVLLRPMIGYITIRVAQSARSDPFTRDSARNATGMIAGIVSRYQNPRKEKSRKALVHAAFG